MCISMHGSQKEFTEPMLYSSGRRRKRRGVRLTRKGRQRNAPGILPLAREPFEEKVIWWSPRRVARKVHLHRANKNAVEISECEARMRVNCYALKCRLAAE
eukprot:446483-Pleurochrysis_carterae.AAC.2